MLKLSKRLQAIDNMITQHYDHLWDCCCDHGYLGMQLLSRRAAAQVHFVDQVPDLMVDLQSKLERFFPNNQTMWSVACSDVATLVLPDVKARHLVIIAGVGGDLAVALVRALLRNNPDTPMEFLLCPVYHTYFVRKSLAGEGLGLINEVLVEEGGRFYELIHVSQAATRVLTPVGSLLWQSVSKAHIAYYHALLLHYQRIAQKGGQEAMRVVEDYQTLAHQIPALKEI